LKTENEEAKIFEPNKINFQKEIDVNFNENDIEDIHLNEKVVFLALYRRLSNPDFMTILKIFSLYTNSVISYLGKQHEDKSVE
jgi:hypothetical protein